MSVPTISWSESEPAGSDNIALGDNVIRRAKTQIREVIDVDHDFPSSGQAADVGQHKKVTLQEQADLGTGAVGATILGSQTVSGKGELVYTDEDDNDIQLTKAGEIYPGATPTLSHWSSIMNLIYPVGFVVTLGVSTNPATLFGIGTWTAIAGKVIVGINAGDAEFDTLDETGGAKTVTLDTTMIPAHNHAIKYNSQLVSFSGGGGGSNWNAADDAESGGSATVFTSDNTGGGLAHNNLQPYIVKYVWQRTA